MNLRQVARIAGPLSFLKSAMVLKSGASRPVSHISSTFALGLPLQPAAGRDLVDVAVDIDLQQQGRMIAGRPVASGTTPSNPSAPSSSSSTNTSITRTAFSYDT